MALWLDPSSGEFTSDGNWQVTTYYEDGTSVIRTCVDGVVTETIEKSE